MMPHMGRAHEAASSDAPTDVPSSSKRVGSLVPVRLLSALRRSRSQLPGAITCRGAVLFADLSRYSTWVEAVVQRGRESLDQIPLALDATFGAWTELVYQSGGEVVQVAGDSLLAVWLADNGSELDALKRADQCARQLCARRAQGPLDEFELGVHVGVGVGEVWTAALGGANGYWNLLVGGEAVRDAAKAQGQAGRWQHCLSSKAQSTLKTTNVVDGYKETSAPISDGESGAWLFSFLPREHRQWFLSEERELLSASSPTSQWTELRPITAVFANIRGLSEDEPGALRRFHQLFCQLQAVLDRHEGPSAQLLVDDKGLVLTAVFGVPGCFNHDDPERALRASVELNEVVRSLGYRCSVGVATGDACFRSVGNTDRRYLTAVGTPMNRAARLMALHTEGVVCDAATERANRAVVVFEPGESLQATGLSTPVQSYRPIGRQTASRLLRPLVGRDQELATLQQALSNARKGRAQIVVVRGEAGIGKSRLVTEFLREVLDDLAPTFVRAERGDRVKSLLPWFRILCQCLHVSEHDPSEDLIDALRSRLADHPDLLERLPLFDVMIGTELGDTETTRQLTGASRADATLRLLVDVLGVLMGDPRLVVFEDGQWLDSASWRVLEWALSQMRSLLVVLCVRAEEEPDELLALIEHVRQRQGGTASESAEAPHATVITLGELSGAGVRALIAQALADAPPSEELVRQISHGSRGNPFFVEEMTRALVDEGLISIRGDEWRAISPDIHFGELEAVERLLTERVDRLPRTAQLALRVASVFGRSVDRASLAKLIPEFELEGEFDRTLAQVCSRGFLRTVGETRLEFTHDHIRDAVYATIPAQSRAELHRQVARHIEEQRRRADWPTLVHHFLACNEAQDAVKYAELAGQDALSSGAFREAQEFFTTCLQFDRTEFDPRRPSAVRALRWRRQLAEACEGKGDVRAQGQAIDDALAYCGRKPPKSNLAAVSRVILALLSAVGWAILTRALLLIGAGRKDAHRELSQVYAQAGSVYFFSHRAEHCVWAMSCALSHGLRAGPCPEQVIALTQVAASLGLVGFRRVADVLLARAQLMASLLNDPAVHARSRMVEGLYRIGLGQWEKGEAAVEECQRHASRVGDALNWCNAQVLRYWIRHFCGDWAAAESAADALLARAQSSGNLQQELWALRCKALSALFTERPREARDHLRMALAALSEGSDLAELLGSKGALALCQARLGNHVESVALAREALELLDRVRRPTVHSSLDSTSGVVEVLLRGRANGLHVGYPRWQEWEERALHHLNAHRLRFPTGEPRYYLWLGLREHLESRTEAAFELWSKGLERARELGMKRDVSLLETEIRRHRDRVPESKAPGPNVQR
jgi:class 3 adenylate cyclase/tetratricopeptide (TPR) repeat protein